MIYSIHSRRRPRRPIAALVPVFGLFTILLLWPPVLDARVQPPSVAEPASRQRAEPAALIETVLLNERTPFTVDDLLDLVSLQIFDLTADGRWIAAATSQRRDRLGTDHTRNGDPTYTSPSRSDYFVLDGERGARIPILPNPARARGFTWSPDGGTLAFFLFQQDRWHLHTWERSRTRLREVRPRTDLPIAATSTLQWLPDGRLLLELRAADWHHRAERLFSHITEGPIVVHDSSEPFLEWDALRNLNALTIPALVDPGSRSVIELLPEGTYSAFNLTEEGSRLSFVQTWPLQTAYTTRGGAEYELQRLDLRDRSTAVLRERSQTRPSVTWSQDGEYFAWTERGDVWIQSIDREQGRNLTDSLRPVADSNDTARVDFSIQRFRPDGEALLLSSRGAWWLLEQEPLLLHRVFDLPREDEHAPRYRVLQWSPQGRHLYVSFASRQEWDRGVMRLDLSDGSTRDLVRGADLYSGWRLSRDGTTWYVQRSDGDLPGDLYRAGSDLDSWLRLTDLNPWIADRTLTRSELIRYLDVDGEALFGILYYPVDYEPGKRYPLVCELYETFFDNGFNANMNLITNAGWFGFRPSVNLRRGYPGESWLKGVTAGINVLIDRGLVDPDLLGVHGTSYGGYATALLVTQTPRFAAAINISGKVNMVSFYGDSPRLGVRNITAPERGQDRIGGSLWEYPERYLAHSAILFADRIETPLMLITGDLDHNVPARQSMEMYYAMRRLEKEVVWVRYVNGGHTPPNTAEETHDFWNRILGWYRTHFEKRLQDRDSP